jgi:putative Mg2+ transporter-C (MgtC) family protein
MIVSEMLFVESAGATPGGSVRSDPARLGAGILTGIGFLGGGAILRHDNLVRGVTTAASLWLVTVLGLTFGSGLYALGFISTSLALLALYVLARFERLLPSDWYATLMVTGTLEALDEAELKRCVEALGPKVQQMKLDYDCEKRHKRVECEVKLKRPQRFELGTRIVATLREQPGILRVEWS